METIYSLKLANGKYYVGKTCNFPRRLLQHIRGEGAKWTSLHRYVGTFSTRQVRESETNLEENLETCRMMLRFGINNVRGGCLTVCDKWLSCASRDYYYLEKEKIKLAIGRFLDISLEDINVILSEEKGVKSEVEEISELVEIGEKGYLQGDASFNEKGYLQGDASLDASFNEKGYLQGDASLDTSFNEKGYLQAAASLFAPYGVVTTCVNASQFYGGAAIMDGLSIVGGVSNSILLLGAIPAAGIVVASENIFEEKEGMNEETKKTYQNTKCATKVGVCLGSASSLGVMTSFGVGPSGLCAIGGSMFSGAVMLVGWPLIAGIALATVANKLS